MISLSLLGWQMGHIFPSKGFYLDWCKRTAGLWHGEGRCYCRLGVVACLVGRAADLAKIPGARFRQRIPWFCVCGCCCQL